MNTRYGNLSFLFDNNLSPDLAAGMKAFGEKVLHLRELYAKDPGDEVWMTEAGKRGFLVVTRDTRILRRPAELQAYRQYRVGVFHLGGKRRTHCDMIRQVVRNWPRMKEVASNEGRPFCFSVPPEGGKLKRLL